MATLSYTENAPERRPGPEPDLQAFRELMASTGTQLRGRDPHWDHIDPEHLTDDERKAWEHIQDGTMTDEELRTETSAAELAAGYDDDDPTVNYYRWLCNVLQARMPTR